MPNLPLPQTAADVRAIERRREQLSSQISSAESRREEIAEQLQDTVDPLARAGLESRLRVLDERIAQLEVDLAATGRQLTNAPTEALVRGADDPPWAGLETGQITAISIVFTIFVLFPLALSAANLMWKRARNPHPKRDRAEVERMERLEHAIETIAVEVERIGEGQRFMTRLLTESNGAAPLPAPQREELVRARGNRD